MERLTQRLRTGEVLMASEYEEKYTEQEWISVLQDRLAAYEETWLTPEEIDMDHEAAEQLRHLCRDCDLDRVEKLAEADKDGRVVVLPFTSGRNLLSKENINSPRLMKDVELAIRYCSSCGIVFHMGYNVFCDLVKHGRITAVSEETEKALEAKKDE
nr:MAG TPA: hypothetical protein [Caudoviricetes sp.]